MWCALEMFLTTRTDVPGENSFTLLMLRLALKMLKSLF